MLEYGIGKVTGTPKLLVMCRDVFEFMTDDAVSNRNTDTVPIV